MWLSFWVTSRWGVDEEKHVWENDGEMMGPVLDTLKPEWPWSFSGDVHKKWI